MKIEIQPQTRSTAAKKIKKLAVDRFKTCPACGSKDLIPFQADVLCARCSWDSCKVSVDSGLMDPFFAPTHRARKTTIEKSTEPAQPIEKERKFTA